MSIYIRSYWCPLSATLEAESSPLGEVEADHYWMKPSAAEPPVLSPAPVYDLPPFEPERLRAEREAANSGIESGEFVFEGAKIRVTPDGKMVASDILRALGQKDPSHTWRNLKKQYPELVPESGTYAFGPGRPPEVLGERGVYKLAMVAVGWWCKSGNGSPRRRRERPSYCEHPRWSPGCQLHRRGVMSFITPDRRPLPPTCLSCRVP